MVKIAFVRHGITDWNIEKRAQGHSANPLNEFGLKQAEAVANRLAHEGKWDILYSSDLMRASQTAEIISADIDIPIIYDQRLREQDRGIIVDTIEEERIQRWGENWRDNQFWQENNRSLRIRGKHFVEEMQNRYPDKHIVAVSHGKFMIETLRELLPLEENISPLENTSISIIKGDTEKGFKYELYNCTCHLITSDLTIQ